MDKQYNDTKQKRNNSNIKHQKSPSGSIGAYSSKKSQTNLADLHDHISVTSELYG